MKTNMESYFKIKCKGGHCGAGKYKILIFYFKGKNLVNIIKKAINMPAVKHHKWNDVISCEEVTYKEYKKGRQISAYHRKELI